MNLPEILKIKNKNNFKKIISDFIGVVLSITLFALSIWYKAIYDINGVFMNILLILSLLVSTVLIILTVIDVLQYIKAGFSLLLTYDKLFINSEIGKIFLRWSDIEHIDNFEVKKKQKFSKEKVSEYIGIRFENYENFIKDTLQKHPKLIKKKKFFTQFKTKNYKTVLSKKSNLKLWSQLREDPELPTSLKKLGKLSYFIIKMVANREKYSFDLVFEENMGYESVKELVLLLNKYKINYEDEQEKENPEYYKDKKNKYYEYEHINKSNKKDELSEAYIKKCYRKLRIPYNSDLKTVKKAYRRLLKIFHPDLWYDDEEKKEKYKLKLLEINRAFQDLERYLH